MGLTHCMKRPVEILYKRLIRPVSHGHSSASITHKGFLFTTLSERNAAGVPNYSKCINGFGIHFTRNYASSSEQVNLIKQLRERTSAPMKEVKSALVACDWAIEAAQNELRKRGVALASKKSSRTAAEGFLGSG